MVDHNDGTKTFISLDSTTQNHHKKEQFLDDKEIVEYLEDRSEDEQPHVTDVVDSR